MANNCFYTMKAVAKDEAILKRLIKIMNYNDDEYYIYRCFNADCDGIEKEGDYYVAYICGDVAWSCNEWFNTNENFEHKSDNAHYITIDILCKKLGFGVEVFSEECGVGFQEYYLVNKGGEIKCNDCVDWSQDWFDEEGNELDEPVEDGGFDDYGCFSNASEIYG